jgi:hypothetical protein
MRVSLGFRRKMGIEMCEGEGREGGRTLLDRSYWFVCDYCGGGCERDREERGEERKEGGRGGRE